MNLSPNFFHGLLKLFKLKFLLCKRFNSIPLLIIAFYTLGPFLIFHVRQEVEGFLWLSIKNDVLEEVLKLLGVLSGCLAQDALLFRVYFERFGLVVGVCAQELGYLADHVLVLFLVLERQI